MLGQIFYFFLIPYIYADLIHIERNESQVEIRLGVRVSAQNEDPQTACLNATVLPICLDEILKISCSSCDAWGRFVLVKNTHDTNFRSEPDSYTYIFQNPDVNRMDCYFCLYQPLIFSRSEHASPAIVPLYFDCNALEKGARKNFWIKEGANSTLHCWDTVLGEDAIVEWYFITLGTEERAFLHSDPDEPIFVIGNMSESQIGTFGCFLWFKTSKIRYERQYSLDLLMHPEKPSHLELTNLDNESVSFSWNTSTPRMITPDQGDLKFLIRYYPLKHQSDNDSWRSLHTDQTEITLRNLMPYTLYMFEIMETNEYGLSRPSKYVFLTRRSNHPTSAYDMEMFGILNRAVKLPCHDYGKTTDVIWQKEAHYNGRSVFENLRHRPASDYSIPGAEIKDGGIYKCIVAHDGTDRGHHFTIRLYILLPPPKPQNLQCNDSGDGTMILKWHQNSDRTELEGGQAPNMYLMSTALSKYRLKFKKLGQGGQWMESTVDKEFRALKLEYMQRGVIYAVQLSAASDHAESDPALCTSIVT